MKAGVLREVDAARRPMPGRAPDLDAIVAYLRTEPELYLQLVQEARIALPWSERPGELGQRASWCRDAASGDEDAGGYVWDSVDDEGWRGCVGSTDLMHGADPDMPMVWATAEEARDAVDSVLIDMGWTLVGPA